MGEGGEGRGGEGGERLGQGSTCRQFLHTEQDA